MNFRTEMINNIPTVMGGLGKMFYQDGFPIGLAVKEIRKNGYRVSIFHIADELLKHGWNAATTFKKLREELIDSMVEFDEIKLKQFINAEYEYSRELLFEYLYNLTYTEVRSNPELIKSEIRYQLNELHKGTGSESNL